MLLFRAKVHLANIARSQALHWNNHKQITVQITNKKYTVCAGWLNACVKRCFWAHLYNMNLIISCTDFFFSWLGNEFCKRSFTIKWVHSIKAFAFESEIAPFWHIQLYQCVGPENINTPITEVHWKFRQGGGSQRPKSLKEGISLNWNFQKGRGFKPKKPSVGGVWIFSGTTQYN